MPTAQGVGLAALYDIPTASTRPMAFMQKPLGPICGGNTQLKISIGGFDSSVRQCKVCLNVFVAQVRGNKGLFTALIWRGTASL